jgi:hypothetical protein
VSAPDLGRSCVDEVWRGVSTAYFSGNAALRGIPAEGAAVALGDSMPPTSLSTLTVSTSELTVVVSTDTIDLVRFLLFFLASVVWVATMVAATREADIFPDVCRVRAARQLLTVNFHQPSYKFTFNVGIDLLF